MPSSTSRLTFHSAVTSEMSEAFRALESASVDSVWLTPKSRHQPQNPGWIAGKPRTTQVSSANGRREREAAPDVDVLVQHVTQALHGGVAQHLEQRGHQGEREPHGRRLYPARGAGPSQGAARKSRSVALNVSGWSAFVA